MNKDDILIVVVVYKENIYSTRTYNSLIKHAPECNIYLYDNSPIEQFTPSEVPANWTYISNPANPGLSHAYNKAAQYAQENGYQWMLLADQDTEFTPNILDKYIDSIQKHPNIKLFAPKIVTTQNKHFSPVRTWHNITINTDSIDSGIQSVRMYSPINSGMMINVDAFIQVGGYNEAVFLDYSDFQFIDRFRKKYTDFYVLDSVCHQNFSNDVQNNTLKLGRYKLFCKSLKHFQCATILDKLGILIVTLKRAAALSYRTASFSPIFIFIKHYVFQ